jgi:hypothetical protein
MALFLAGGVLGAALSLILADWHARQTWVALWITTSLAVAAVVLSAFAGIAGKGRDQMRERNGIAYIVREPAGNWQRDDPEGFTSELRQRFVDVIEVPGPRHLGSGWDWPLDEGARQWDERLDELVRSFRTLYLTRKSPGTTNAMFIYASWPVAVGLGARLTAADRSLSLAVGQRPSDARAGNVRPDLWVHLPQSFTDAAPQPDMLASPGSGLFTHPALLTVSGGSRRAEQASRKVAVLLLRIRGNPWGPIPQAGKEPAEAPAVLRVHDYARTGLTGDSEVVVHELRCIPPAGETVFAWEDFPALAVMGADWIERKAAELDEHVLLLGANMPNEIALGLGICAGQLRRAGWPEHLWPLMHQPETGSFVIPRLDLGAISLPGRG